ncbi:MAG: hypothetical protein ACXVX9_06830 [Mycobacteriaceae bacterium]
MPKRQRLPFGVDDLMIAFSAKGLTAGEISAYLAAICGAGVLHADHLHDHRPGDR